MARRTAYDPRKLELVEGWARNGLTNAEIAANLGVTAATLYDWQKAHPEFAQALATGREVADLLVENALFRRAVGFSYDETTREAKPNPDTGRYELVVTKVVTKTVVPDVAAAMAWLTNRQPEKWRREVPPVQLEVSQSGAESFIRALTAVAPTVWADESDEHQGGHDDGDAA